jgi:hypothetical protein
MKNTTMVTPMTTGMDCSSLIGTNRKRSSTRPPPHSDGARVVAPPSDGTTTRECHSDLETSSRW